MRPVVAVDLAAKFTAGVSLDPAGGVVSQWDSFRWSHSQVAEQILSDYLFLLGRYQRPIVVVEDLPPHVPSSLVTKAVAQLQGRILHVFSTAAGQWVGRKFLDDLFFVPPAYWQHAMGVFGASTEQAEAVAGGYGYTPPDVVNDRGYQRGTRGSATLVREADKQRTDYVSAYLIAQWVRDSMAAQRVWDMGIVRQYEA